MTGEIVAVNETLLEDLELKKNDIPLFQVTRIVRRKGIETAIEVIHQLNDDRIKLVITGSAADDARKGYYKELLIKIKERKLEKHVVFSHRIILNERR